MTTVLLVGATTRYSGSIMHQVTHSTLQTSLHQHHSQTAEKVQTSSFVEHGLLHDSLDLNDAEVPRKNNE